MLWEQPFWVIKSELAQEKSFISTLAIGNVATPQETESGFEIFRLKDKHPERLKTIEERYTDIANILRRPRYMQLVDEYKAKLFATSSVQYL
jgi:parvulin-like peptidyl-prolyl isomerase